MCKIMEDVRNEAAQNAELNDGYWKGVPDEYIEGWKNIFLNSMEGPDLSACCPVCRHKELHRYYQTGGAVKASECPDQNIVKGAEWQWCSYCRTYEHAQVMVPDWWISRLEIDGNKLTAIPEILDMAYQDEKRVNKWRDVPERYLKLWEQIFHENNIKAELNEKCPVCNEKMLRQYYMIGRPGPVRYKKMLYKGQGGHWEWCAACFRYRYDYSSYVPLDWDYELEIEPWKLMTIPEPINERMNSRLY